MKPFAIGAFAAALFVAGAASAATIDAMTANTLTVTDQAGVTLSYQFNTDGSYTVAMPDGSAGDGVWRVNASQFCFTPTGADEACVAAPPAGKGPGDSWTTADPTGAPVTVSIVSGR